MASAATVPQGGQGRPQQGSQTPNRPEAQRAQGPQSPEARSAEVDALRQQVNDLTNRLTELENNPQDENRPELKDDLGPDSATDVAPVTVGAIAALPSRARLRTEKDLGIKTKFVNPIKRVGRHQMVRYYGSIIQNPLYDKLLEETRGIQENHPHAPKEFIQAELEAHVTDLVRTSDPDLALWKDIADITKEDVEDIATELTTKVQREKDGFQLPDSVKTGAVGLAALGVIGATATTATSVFVINRTLRYVAFSIPSGINASVKVVKSVGTGVKRFSNRVAGNAKTYAKAAQFMEPAAKAPQGFFKKSWHHIKNTPRYGVRGVTGLVGGSVGVIGGTLVGTGEVLANDLIGYDTENGKWSKDLGASGQWNSFTEWNKRAWDTGLTAADDPKDEKAKKNKSIFSLKTQESVSKLQAVIGKLGSSDAKRLKKALLNVNYQDAKEAVLRDNPSWKGSLPALPFFIGSVLLRQERIIVEELLDAMVDIADLDEILPYVGWLTGPALGLVKQARNFIVGKDKVDDADPSLSLDRKHFGISYPAFAYQVNHQLESRPKRLANFAHELNMDALQGDFARFGNKNEMLKNLTDPAYLDALGRDVRRFFAVKPPLNKEKIRSNAARLIQILDARQYKNFELYKEERAKLTLLRDFIQRTADTLEEVDFYSVYNIQEASQKYSDAATAHNEALQARRDAKAKAEKIEKQEASKEKAKLRAERDALKLKRRQDELALRKAQKELSDFGVLTPEQKAARAKARLELATAQRNRKRLGKKTKEERAARDAAVAKAELEAARIADEKSKLGVKTAEEVAREAAAVAKAELERKKVKRDLDMIATEEAARPTLEAEVLGIKDALAQVIDAVEALENPEPETEETEEAPLTPPPPPPELDSLGLPKPRERRL